MFVSTHSRAEAAALATIKQQEDIVMFQHTAARRRLHGRAFLVGRTFGVSTHSRAEAAAQKS